jgi:hypothetical protein
LLTINIGSSFSRKILGTRVEKQKVLSLSREERPNAAHRHETIGALFDVGQNLRDHKCGVDAFELVPDEPSGTLCFKIHTPTPRSSL